MKPIHHETNVSGRYIIPENPDCINLFQKPKEQKHTSLVHLTKVEFKRFLFLQQEEILQRYNSYDRFETGSDGRLVCVNFRFTIIWRLKNQKGFTQLQPNKRQRHQYVYST